MIDGQRPDYEISLTDIEHVIGPGGESGLAITGGISGVDKASIERGKEELGAANAILNELGIPGEITFSEPHRPDNGKRIFGGNPLKKGKYDDEVTGFPWSVNLGEPPADASAN